MVNRNKKIILIVSTILTVVMALSLSYAFFTYSKRGSTITLKAGNIAINLQEDVNFFTLQDTYPISDSAGMNSPNYYDFTVSGSKGKNDDILYEIQIEQLEDNTLKEKYVNVYLTNQEDEKIGATCSNLVDLPISQHTQNRIVYSHYIYDENQVEDYRLRVWIDESYTKNVQETFNFKVVLYAINDNANYLYDTVEDDLASYLLPVDGEGDYDSRIISGSKTDENLKNYVWYSGKLWRIVSLNNNGTIKLITQDNISAIAYNPSNQTAFAGSYMYQWLNEDFLDTLYNYEGIIDMQSKWNATEITGATKPANTTIVESPVGLLNAYEYIQSSSYLNIGYEWWLLTPYSSSTVHSVNDHGSFFTDVPLYAHGARPSINLKSNIIISGGSGTKTDPYRLVGDIVTNSTLLNERVSGEYVNFNGGIYRIVNIENSVTKITAINNVLSANKAFGASNSELTYGMHVTKNNDGTYQGNSNYVDGYLNTEWYNNLDSDYKNMIVEGTWYLGMYGDNVSYKQTICDPNITGNLNKTTKTCSKNPSIWIGPVGLGRAGEMFTSQLGNGYSDPGSLWTITPYSSSRVRNVDDSGTLNKDLPISANGARPSINLKSNITISGGLGTLESPFEITMK